MKENTLLLEALIAVELVQVMTLVAAVQVQSALFAPPSATAPLAMVKPVGNTSTTVIVPEEAVLPVLLTVRV